MVRPNGEMEMKNYGWTILPLFSYDGFVNSGVF